MIFLQNLDDSRYRRWLNVNELLREIELISKASFYQCYFLSFFFSFVGNTGGGNR